jgi:sugar lactone lactonase YvrE
VLVRLEYDGRITGLDRDLGLSNGLAWSSDGRHMFSVDTLRRTIYVREYDSATGETGQRRVHIRLDDGYPDGIAMDADDHLWVAVWGAGEIRRFAPGGSTVDSFGVPAVPIRSPHRTPPKRSVHSGQDNLSGRGNRMTPRPW